MRTRVQWPKRWRGPETGTIAGELGRQNCHVTSVLVRRDRGGYAHIALADLRLAGSVTPVTRDGRDGSQLELSL